MGKQTCWIPENCNTAVRPEQTVSIWAGPGQTLCWLNILRWVCYQSQWSHLCPCFPFKVTNLKSRVTVTFHVDVTLTSHSHTFHHLLFLPLLFVCVFGGAGKRDALLHWYMAAIYLKLQMYNNSNKPSAVYSFRKLVATAVFTVPVQVGFNHCVLSNQTCTRHSDQ